MRRFFQYICLFVVVCVLMGCFRTQPIYNVDTVSIPPIAESKGSLEKTGTIITKAAVALRWHVEKVRPGILHCSLRWRRHKAVVAISYSVTNYSIQYLSSENLLEGMGEIHRKYNRNVLQLQNNIDQALAKASNG
ncbi:MAG TPA: hypothetical protein DD400_02995 [Rhodospirillaceae bacterium]|nr:hypothetical protein [Rhodospirillaceae bacterium]